MVAGAKAKQLSEVDQDICKSNVILQKVDEFYTGNLAKRKRRALNFDPVLNYGPHPV
jgi:hypothetical protein